MSLMRCASRLLALFLVSPLLTQCGTKTAPAAGAVTGPFDSRGNYIEDWVDQPDKWYKPSTPAERAKPRTSAPKKETPPPQIAVVPPNMRDVTPRTTPPVVKPKPVVKVTPKPKPKPPATVRHTVRKGDTLSGLARRYGSTVSKIQAANRIKGSVIRLGQTLTIPK